MDLFEPVRTAAAIDLMDMLNMDVKPKDHYHLQYYFQHDDYFVLMVANKEKHCLFNVIDLYGEVPKGFTPCWRVYAHIKRELRL